MSKQQPTEMTASLLGVVASLFLDLDFESEFTFERFRLDFYNPEKRIAFEYDGPEHYCDVWHIERDLRKDALCSRNGIIINRWPYYFQLTKDIAKHFFKEYYSEAKYTKAIELVYGCRDECRILAPGLHRSKNTPANYVKRGLNRFINEMNAGPASLRSQVVYSFDIYRKRMGSELEWLIVPSDSRDFDRLMADEPDPTHLNYYYPFANRAPDGASKVIEHPKNLKSNTIDS